MKFVCDRCGKKYATAEDPAPGKVYKLKCKACGHLIVVRAQAGTSTALPAVTPAEAAPPTQGPEIELHIEPEPAPAVTPPPAAGPPVPEQVDDAVIIDAPLPPEVASAIDAAAPVPAPPPELQPPPPDKDELADFAAAAAEVMAAPAAGAPGAGYVDLFSEGVTGERKVEPQAGKPDDPFVAAARASLPEGYLGSGAPDPFAPPPAPPPEPSRPAAAPPAKPAPKPAAKPASGAKSTGMPVALIGGGLVVLLVIAGVAVMRGGKKPEPPPEPVVVNKAERPAPAPAPAPPEPAPEPPKAEPVVVPEPKPEPKPAVVERKPEPRAAPKPPEPKPAPKPEPPRVAAAAPEPKPAPPPPPPAPAPEEKPDPRTETRDVTLPDAEAALTPEVVQKVINANRKAFASCIAASAGTGIQLDGRKVALRLTVNANGAVTYPTLDDVTLNSTEMGQCLKSAARLMIFPKFKGDPFHVEVPLTLSAN